MQLTIKKEDIIYPLRQAGAVLAKKSMLPILSCLLFEANDNGLTLISGDGGNTQYNKVTIEPEFVNISQKGRIAIPGGSIIELIEKFNGIIEINTKETEVTVKCGEAEYQFVGVDADEYPDLPKTTGNGFEMEADLLKSMVKEVSFAALKDNSFPEMTGIRFDYKDGNLRMTAADKARMAMSEVAFEKEPQFEEVIVRCEELDRIMKFLPDKEPIKIEVLDRWLCLSFASSLYFVGVLSGKYLEIDRAIPKTFGLEVIVDRRDFLESIERANFVSREASDNDVLLAINDDRITIVAKTGKGKAVESLGFIKKTGTGINIALKAKNAIDALKVIKSDKVIVKFNAANTPVIIEPEDGTLSLYLIQPFLMREKYKEWLSSGKGA